jgi:hypothetical protein
VKDVLEARARVRPRERLLAVGEDLRAQLDSAGRIETVHVAEGRRQQIAPAPTGSQDVGDAQQICRRRVQAVAADALAADAVLLTADHTALNLEHDAQLAAPVEQLGGHPQVLLERQRRAVEHVRVEQQALATVHLLARGRKQRAQERRHVLRWAVVGVERNRARVTTRQLPAQRSERARPGQPIVSHARQVTRSAYGDLHDAVRLGLREPAHRRVKRLRRRHVDRRKRVPPGCRAIQHLQVLLWARQHPRIIARLVNSAKEPTCAMRDLRK